MCNLISPLKDSKRNYERAMPSATERKRLGEESNCERRILSLVAGEVGREWAAGPGSPASPASSQRTVGINHKERRIWAPPTDKSYRSN